MAIHVLLLVFDGLPVLHIGFSLLAHALYLTNFTAQWPFISLASPQFILSCISVVANHFIWFFYFAEKAQEAKAQRQTRYRYGNKRTTTIDSPSFLDVAAFFAICVWLVPLFLFLSLSANDNVLPSQGDIPSTPSGRAVDLGTPTANASASLDGSSARSFPFPTARTSLVKSILTPVLSLLPRLRGGKRKDFEGIIAPRTPLKGSPQLMPTTTGYSPWGAPDHDVSSPGGFSLNYSSGQASLQIPARNASPFSPAQRLSPLNTNGPNAHQPGPPRRTVSDMYISGRHRSPSQSSLSRGSGASAVHALRKSTTPTPISAAGSNDRSSIDEESEALASPITAEGSEKGTYGSHTPSSSFGNSGAIRAVSSGAEIGTTNTMGLATRRAGKRDD